VRVLYSSRKVALTSVVTIVAFAVNACTPIELKKVVAQKADYYRFTSQQNGIGISVDPYKEKDRLEECCLSRDLTPYLQIKLTPLQFFFFSSLLLSL